jgi:tRNA pseudouridine55 synthase
MTNLNSPAACGILLLDKPAGLSSNAALQRVRRLLGRPKAGHTGSLDPLATGMLPICVGEATKIAGELLAGRKAYVFEIQLGARTDTGDAEGQVVERCAVPALDEARVAAAIAPLRGPQEQVPPMYSALKRAGQPLYRLARQGITVERAARPIVIHALDLLELAPTTVRLRADCSKGTYVRVLAEQIALNLGSCGHLTMLRREYVEPFAAEAMHTLEALEALAAAGASLPVLPADRGVEHLEPVHLDAPQSRAMAHGQTVTGCTGPEGLVRLYSAPGAFMGLGRRIAGGAVRPQRLFCTPTEAHT